MLHKNKSVLHKNKSVLHKNKSVLNKNKSVLHKNKSVLHKTLFTIHVIFCTRLRTDGWGGGTNKWKKLLMKEIAVDFVYSRQRQIWNFSS